MAAELVSKIGRRPLRPNNAMSSVRWFSADGWRDSWFTVGRILLIRQRTLKSYVGNDHEKKARWDADNTHGHLDEFLERIGRRRERARMLDEWAPKQDDESRAFDTDAEDLGPVDEETRINLEVALVRYRHRLKKKKRRDATTSCSRTVVKS